jgi:hypothetical protein
LRLGLHLYAVGRTKIAGRQRHWGIPRAPNAFWSVEDVDAEVAELKSRGVKFEEYDMPGIKTVEGIATGGGAQTAWFKLSKPDHEEHGLHD